MRIALIQARRRPFSWEASESIPQDSIAESLVERVDEAASAGAELICLPELALRPWFMMERPRAALPVLEPAGAIRALSETCKRWQCCVHLTELTSRNGHLFNAAVLLTPGGFRRMYSKRHLPSLSGFRERDWCTPGTRASGAHEACGGLVASLTCTDIMFPEDARRLGRSGCDLLLAPRASLAGAAEARWEVMLRANAIVSGAFVVSCNRLGTEGAVEFAGRSSVIAPNGAVICDMARTEGVVHVDVDLTEATRAKAGYPVTLEVA